jgi:hypothetical protein
MSRRLESPRVELERRALTGRRLGERTEAPAFEALLPRKEQNKDECGEDDTHEGRAGISEL